MEEKSIYISSVDREKVGVSKTHDFKIKLQTTLKLDCNMKNEIALDSAMLRYSWHNIITITLNTLMMEVLIGKLLLLLMVCTHMKIFQIICISIWLIKDMLKKINIQ